MKKLNKNKRSLNVCWKFNWSFKLPKIFRKKKTNDSIVFATAFGKYIVLFL